MMQPWLLLDVETTGTDPKIDRLVEVGAVLFDPNLGVPVRAESILIGGEGNAAEAINRIPAAALRGSWCMDEAEALERICEMTERVPYLLAHNAEFDRQWLDGSMPPGARWICTYTEAQWPRSATGTLASIALQLDLGVARAHRAIEDCLLLAAILGRTHEIEGGLGAWLDRATEARVTIDAHVTYEKRELAKQHGFHWSPERRAWWRDVRVSQLDAFCASLPFKTSPWIEPFSARG